MEGQGGTGRDREGQGGLRDKITIISNLSHDQFDYF